MENSAWTDWTADVERAFGWLKERTATQFVAGLSMGGTLALWTAERHPEVAGLITRVADIIVSTKGFKPDASYCPSCDFRNSCPHSTAKGTGA